MREKHGNRLPAFDTNKQHHCCRKMDGRCPGDVTGGNRSTQIRCASFAVKVPAADDSRCETLTNTPDRQTGSYNDGDDDDDNDDDDDDEGL